MNKKIIWTFCLAIALSNAQSDYNKAFCATKSTYEAGISKNYDQINALIDKGNYKEAEDTIQNLLTKNPNDSALMTTLGTLYSAQYKLDGAQKAMQKAIELNPNNADAHNGLGLVYYKKTTSSNMDLRGNTKQLYDMALKEFNTAIKLNPESYKAYNNAGKVNQEIGQLNKAEELYKKALEIEPNYSEAVTNLGKVLFEKNQVDEAIAKYHRAIELNRKNSSAYYALGEALVYKGEYSKAINYLNTSLYLFSNSAPVHFMLGKAYELQGNQAAAINEYKKSTLIKPEYAEPYLSIAGIYQDRGDNELAISELKNALSINPNFLEGKLKIADISLAKGDADEAIKYYKSVMNNPVYSKYALKGLSKAYFARARQTNEYANSVSESEYIEAENALKEAIKYNPDDIQLCLALLRISKLTNNNYQSVSYLNKIVQNPSNYPINSIVKGEAYLTYKKYKDTSKEFDKAISFVNDKKDLIYIGEIFIMNRQYDSAKIAFNRVLQTDPNNMKAKRALERIQKNKEAAFTKYNVAKGMYKQGMQMAAIETLKECLDLNPQLPEAQLLIAKAFEHNKYYYNALDSYTAYMNLIPAYGKEYHNVQKKIEKLNNKITNYENNGKEISKYTRI